MRLVGQTMANTISQSCVSKHQINTPTRMQITFEEAWQSVVSSVIFRPHKRSSTIENKRISFVQERLQCCPSSTCENNLLQATRFLPTIPHHQDSRAHFVAFIGQLRCEFAKMIASKNVTQWHCETISLLMSAPATFSAHRFGIFGVGLWNFAL